MATISSNKFTGRSTQRKYAAAGRCERCGERSCASQTLCEACLESHNHATSELKARLLKEGRCVWCGQTNRSDYRACDRCRERYNAGRRASR